jgi:hypothetical protein
LTDYFQNIPIPIPNKEMFNITQKLSKEKVGIAEISKWVILCMILLIKNNFVHLRA